MYGLTPMFLPFLLARFAWGTCFSVLRLGAFTDTVPNTPEFGEEVEPMVRKWAAQMGVPYLGAARIGHSRDNWVVPFGMK